jgi:hypothetical protein
MFARVGIIERLLGRGEPARDSWGDVEQDSRPR